jgi:hypothetical protein
MDFAKASGCYPARFAIHAFRCSVYLTPFGVSVWIFNRPIFRIR